MADAPPALELPPEGPAVAAVMGQLWEAMSDLLGTAATATLLRRAAKRAAVRVPELAGLSITKNAFEYQYSVPASWKTNGDAKAMDALCELTRHLRPLLVELTGPVVVRRLDAIPELRRCVPPMEGNS